MKTPSFRHMGGKARLRTWLISHFPSNIETYVEPFAGKANVFFEAKKVGIAKRYVLNDLDTNFLCALVGADLSLLPEKVDKTDFSYWKDNPSLIAKLLEPRITFAGKGYKHGYSGSSGTHVGYSRDSYLQVCKAAREMLEGQDVEITTGTWQAAVAGCDSNSFVYLDPPYLGTKSCYENIDHSELIAWLNQTKARWAVSGYSSPAYEKTLIFTERFEKKRNSEIKSSNSGNYEEVTEVLWTRL